MDHKNNNTVSPIIVKIPFSSFSVPLSLRKSKRLKKNRNESTPSLTSSISPSHHNKSSVDGNDKDDQLRKGISSKKKSKVRVAVGTTVQNSKKRKISSRPSTISSFQNKSHKTKTKEQTSKNVKGEFLPSKKISKSSPPTIKILSSDLLSIEPNNEWIDLNVSPNELRPSATLTTGQCFNWLVVERDDKKKGHGHHNNFSEAQKKASVSAWGTHYETEWVGPLGNRVIAIRETPTTTLYRVLFGSLNGVEECLRNYFQLETPLSSLYELWSQNDPKRLKRIAKVIPGVRILRQDPIECLFSFLCSSNNNIPRITKMLASIRSTYGVKLLDIPTRSTSVDEENLMVENFTTIYSFPTLRELQLSNEESLREMGLGYRAKFIVQTIIKLIDLGGEDFLLSLRKIDNPEIVQNELIQFSGVGRKVADCVALFSLDQYNAIPVDVHVMHIASRDYDTSLSNGTIKSLTPTIYKRIGDLFRNKFSSYAGWAHSLLFVAELPSFRNVLPNDILKKMDKWKRDEMEKKAIEKSLKKRKAREK